MNHEIKGPLTESEINDALDARERAWAIHQRERDLHQRMMDQLHAEIMSLHAMAKEIGRLREGDGD